MNWHPLVKTFLAQRPIRMFVGGQWTPAADENELEVQDPGQGTVIAKVAAAEAPDIDRAVEAAQRAFRTSSWATMPNNDRAVILHRLADLVDEHLEPLAQIESLDVGKPLGQAKGFDIPNVAQTLRY
ncbi:MAG: aldehyde dehydrogenase family protein [Phycisphaeraceae bacterium]|nr:aldehyde dehydrogenase family protein [Phycisphaeraceae bacterium]